MGECEARVKYTESHEWVKVEGEMGTVGISTFAQKELGQIVYLELPKVGKQIEAGDEVVVLESTKAAADIYAPVSGEVIEVNDGLVQNVELLNRAPESDGWLFKVRMKNPAELNNLLSKDQYEKLTT